ncbi:MAG: proprotein convertase P-domain-containing protein [Flavobacteriales bacterium]|nr:proprotein convertase P-domain-containing protein [Flavobacteriales bacterium]MCB9166422.1 proprotein convertase P-domain-containing protein [Flavobacteriales bacterium]
MKFARTHVRISRSFQELLLGTTGLVLVCALGTKAAAQTTETFTSTGVFTAPPGVTQVTVECWGGGGRGGSRNSNGNGGGGGGGGAYARSVLTVVPGNNYTVTVGAGSTSNTAAGGDSWFGTNTTILAKGGSTVALNSSTGAAGGTAAASIGTVKFNGGTGATVTGSNGGGGGSSAGTAANGSNGAGSNGGTAPAGGGDGGDGRTGTNGNGSAGSDPGGGGGGARRTSGGGTRNGGNGADGQVLVTYTYLYTNGTCMAAASYNAIPDNGCGSNNAMNLTIPISGLPTTLGTAPGNARLLSIDLIVEHTYNADLEITLISPTAQSRLLVADRFGSGNNLGNPSTCPNTLFTLQDGGTALNNTNTSNVTGTYAPEQTLAAFTGDPNGNWILSVCDDANVDLGNVRYVHLNFCEVPQITGTSSNSPFCVGSTLTLGVTATGSPTPTYSWSGTGTFSPNNTSANVSVTGGAAGNYNITVSNTCGSDNTNVAVTTTAPPSASNAGSDQSDCFRETFTLAANTPGTGTGAWSVVSGPSLNASQFINSASPTSDFVADGGPGTYVLRWTISNGSCTPETDDVAIDANTTCSYYSRSSGNETDPIWAITPAGTPGAAVWSTTSSATVQSGDAITVNSATWTVYDLDVQGGGSVDLGGNSLEVYGTSLNNDGGFSVTTGAVHLSGGSTVTMDGTGDWDLYDLIIDGVGGDQQSTELKIRGSLDVNNGSFNANTLGVPGRRLVLASGATGTGRLGPIVAPGTFTGEIIMERYVPGGATDWRLISAATNNNHLSSLEDDFITAGYPGSHFPNFDDPPGSNILWPSIRTYDETNTGTALNDGLIGATSDAMVMAAGQGFAAWSGTTLTTTTPFTIDLRSTPRQGSYVLPMSYTSTGNPSVDGWNLVGNPLPSPIDFTNVSLGADVEDQFWAFDPSTGNYVYWDEGTSTGSSVMNGNIQSMQGFWLHATGSNVSTTVNETSKTLDPNGGAPFGGLDIAQQPLLRLGLEANMNQFSDEHLIHFGTGNAGMDATDMEKFFFAHPEAPQLWTSATDGTDLGLNAWGEVTGDVTIPVKVKAAVTGNYTLTVMQLTDTLAAGHCLELEDTQQGTTIPVVVGTTYDFDLDASTPADPARFLLHISTQPEGELTASSTQVAIGEPVQFGSGAQLGITVNWDFGDGSFSMDPEPVHSYGTAGTYPVTLTLGTVPCDLVLTTDVEVMISTGLDEEGDDHFTAWMRNGSIEIDWSGGAVYSSIEVMDVGGRLVRVVPINGVQGHVSVTMSDLPNGIYTVRAIGDHAPRVVVLPMIR